MNILGIETSCDETSAAIVREGREVRSNVIASQTDIHARYGGVVPELASRQHITAIVPTVEEAIRVAGSDRDEIDAIAVTEGPGLSGSLLVGVNLAKTLAFAWKKPLVPVNHLEGHIYSNWLRRKDDDTPEPEFPAVCLIVSGGHSELLLVHRHGVYEILGRTLDDAAGEAFDKGARILGLGYPGGPAIQNAAEGARLMVEFPRAWLGDSYDFSFSGVKTALLRECDQYRRPKDPRRTGERDLTAPFPEHDRPEYSPNMPVAGLAASYQDAIVDVLVTKTVRAAGENNARSVLLAGGVAANKLLRNRLARQLDVPLHVPPIEYCTDNAAMIAGAGYQIIRRGVAVGWGMDVKAQYPLDAVPGIQIVQHGG
ncbi:tRNA (adenosine(37)-N6)-threonylcarbamoyltransferase complex transferase subunit TsaD [soil metagenome]